MPVPELPASDQDGSPPAGNRLRTPRHPRGGPTRSPTPFRSVRTGPLVRQASNPTTKMVMGQAELAKRKGREKRREIS
ncbi:hypothetical protein BHM03_00040711 [Ensete ventricosum]|nr:hypothetical protein BHM03_00040711 [Ensete ventricosum]